MNIEEATELVNGTYILTESEKSQLIKRLQNQDQRALEILSRYGQNRDHHILYDDLNRSGFLQVKRHTPTVLFYCNKREERMTALL